MRKILVTGGAGFIGANFIHYWLKHHKEDQIINLDALTYASNLKYLKSISHFPNYKFVHGNILDQSLLDTLFAENNIQIVIHFAAESHVDRSIINPENFIKTNVNGTYTLLEAAKKYWLDNKNQSYRFHHVSTDEVYGSLGPQDIPFLESSPFLPNSPYAASKAAADHLLRAYYQTYGLPITISHCSNNYGPFQHTEKFIPTIIRACLEWQPIPIYGNGSNIRDWIYVTDHCSAIDFIIHKAKSGETFNVGANNEINNLELATMICHVMDKIRPMKKSYRSLISFVEDRPGHDWRYAINSSKLESQLDFSTKIKFQEGLIKTIAYYKDLILTVKNAVAV